MEFAVKWMYSVDKALYLPYQDNLQNLMNGEDFRDIVGNDIWQRMDFIRKVGNSAAHGGRKVTGEQAELCLENLYIFLDFVAYCYGKNYKSSNFDKSLLELTPEEALSFVPDNNIDLSKLIEENRELKEELTARVPSSSKPMFKSRLTFRNTKRARFILTLCWRTPAGARAGIGLMK